MGQPLVSMPSLSVALCLLLAAGAGAPPPAIALDTGWKRLASGLEFRILDGGASCRRGSRAVAIARLDPARWRVEPFTTTEKPGARETFNIDAWQRSTGATVVFNAGEYYPDRVPMGLFVKQGRNLGSHQLANWKALLVAEPSRMHGGRRLARAGILDLEHDTFKLAATPWRVVVQSFMLLDRDGRKRVRRSDWLANRTIVAVDRRGRLLALHTEGGWTLWDVADWIARSDLGVRQAMAMDGGFESQLCVRAGGFEYLSYGQWHIDDRGDRSVAGLRVPLPVVIGLFPRR